MANALVDINIRKLTPAEAAKKYNIPLATVLGYAQGKYTLPSNEMAGRISIGPQKLQPQSTDTANLYGNKTKRSWTNQQMSDAMNDVKLRKMSQSDAARKYNIPLPTLSS